MTASVAGTLAVLLALLGASAAPVGAVVPVARTGAGGDAPTCAGEPATLVGTSGDDVLRGTPGRDVVVALGGDDRLVGRDGADLLCAGPGADVVLAGPGADVVHDQVNRRSRQRLDGGRGDDTLVLGWRVVEDGEVVPVDVLTDLRAGRVVLGETGRSFPLASFRTLRAVFSEGLWSVRGTSADERFTAHQYQAVTVRAGRGRDVIDGSWHDDVIHGGPGRDTAYADRGRDTCTSVERGRLAECERRH